MASPEERNHPNTIDRGADRSAGSHDKSVGPPGERESILWDSAAAHEKKSPPLPGFMRVRGPQGGASLAATSSHDAANASGVEGDVGQDGEVEQDDDEDSLGSSDV